MKVEATGEQLPAQICLGCTNDLRKMIATSSGGALLAQERAKEQHRINLWKGRVSLIKQARTCMTQKMFSEAAVAYEKYIKILEIVFDCDKGKKLNPQLFKESARTSELTVVVSVYWDLIRIYDSNSKYHDRQVLAAQQLAKFAQFTPIFPDIIKRAESFSKSAKNPAAVKQFLKLAAKERPRCFIATAAFENPRHPQVQTLRLFRDQILKQTRLGRWLVCVYYSYSPGLAKKMDEYPSVKFFIRLALRPVSILASILLKFLPSRI